MVINPALPVQSYYFALLANIIFRINLALHEILVLFATTTSFHKTEEEINDEHLIILEAQKDPKYFSPIYERYFDPIFIYINKRIDNEDITAELTSRVFFQALKNLKKYKFQGVPFSAWLYRIAINEINLFFRQQKVMERSTSLNEQHVDLLIEELERNEPEIDKYVLVSVLLEQLPPQDLQFLELRFFENSSYKEMGYLMGISEGNAKIKTYRIIDKLKKLSADIKYHD